MTRARGTSMRAVLRGELLLGVGLALALEGCRESRVVPAGDAAAGPDARADVTSARGRRGRGRRGRRVAVANTNANENRAARTTESPAEDPGGGDDEQAPEPRPRITERGPMLPEDLGAAPSMQMDLTQANEGPLGIEPSQVSRGLDPLMGRFQVCAAATDAQGRVSVRLRIRADGTPLAARVSLNGNAGAEFLPCVRRVVASARFARFNGPDAMVNWGFSID